MQRLPKIIVALIVLLGLSACTTIEKQPEIKKNPLPKLTEHRVKPKLVWTNTESSGVLKNPVALRLAVTETDIFVADVKGKLSVLNRQTGKTLKTIATKTTLSAGPFVADNKVLLGAEDGSVLAYDISSGQRLWQTSVSTSVMASPVMAGGMVFVHGLEGNLVALKATDGQPVWNYNVQAPLLMLRKNSMPVLTRQSVIVGFSNGKLVCFDRLDGSVVWQREVAISQGRSDIQRMVDISADPVIEGHQLYVVSYQGQIAAVSVETGDLLWERPLSSYAGLAVSKTRVFVSDTSGVIWALNRKTGDVLWKEAGLTGRQLSAPAVMGDLLVVADEDGYLHWLSQKEPGFIGQQLVDSKGIEATPVVKGNSMYILGKSGKVAAFEGY